MRPNRDLPLQRWVRKRPMAQLPLELEMNILLRLPIKALLRCECVCKRWRDEIKSSYFMDSYRRSKAFRGNNNDSLILFLVGYWRWSPLILSAEFHSSKDGFGFGLRLARNPIPRGFSYTLPCNLFLMYNLVGCCNGLFLYNWQDYKNYNSYTRLMFLIYNPAMGDTKTLHHIAPCRTEFLKVGFGYDCTSDDYKILCLYWISDHPADTNSYLYSLRTDSWKIIQAHPPIELRYFNRISSSNNAMIWLTWDSNRSIVCFDLGTEEYHVVRLPEHGSRYSEWELVDLRGCSHLVRYDVPRWRHKKGHMRIWVMKGYGSTRSWAKLVDNITFEHDKIVKPCESSSLQTNNIVFPDQAAPPLPCAYSEDGHELLISPGNSVPSFTCYQLQSGELKRVEISRLPRDLLDGAPYFGYRVMLWTASLVQL